ncbi:MAG: radical SAM protein [bacterium]
MNLKDKIDYFESHLRNCSLCPRECGVNRLKGELGYCNAGAIAKIASYCLHMGEEPPISGTRGSGTIFFSHCNMRCVYCQNFPISQLRYGNQVTDENLAQIMLDLQNQGAHNINLVTPTQFLPSIAKSIATARNNGLTTPIVYNTSGYEKPETIDALRGLVQILLFDIRYQTSQKAKTYSDAPDYPRFNRASLERAIYCFGPLKLDNGIAYEGVIIRHLLIPSLLSETAEILYYISRNVPRGIPISLMSQYFPANRAHEYPEINRKINAKEYRKVIDLVRRLNLEEGWIQERRQLTRAIA